MSAELESLLEPSLTPHHITRPMYSLNSHVLVAFFGGLMGLFLFSLYSIRHAGQLSRWWVLYVCLFLYTVSVQIYLGYGRANGFPEWMPTNLLTVNRMHTIMSLLAMAILYFLQRHLFSVSMLKGESPSPWIPGILCSVLGVVCFFLVVMGVYAYGS